jgi:hypothetical protein
MTFSPPLTISLFNQLSDRELQANYLNHVDRTSEIASVLATITDRDLALRIINLALEFVILGAVAVSSTPQPVNWNCSNHVVFDHATVLYLL